MPPRFKFTREEIISAGLQTVQEKGFDALSARAIASKLGASPKPIFDLFTNMDELEKEVIKAAKNFYNSYMSEKMSKGDFPVYKSSGMAYICFAMEERELFRLLFMRDRSNEQISDEYEEIRPILKIIMNNLGIDEDSAYIFHLELWIYVHGIATMLATSYLNWDIKFISDSLTDVYLGLKHRYTEGKEV